MYIRLHIIFYHHSQNYDQKIRKKPATAISKIYKIVLGSSKIPG